MSGELALESVIKNYLITANSGKNDEIKLYGLAGQVFNNLALPILTEPAAWPWNRMPHKNAKVDDEIAM